MPNLKDKHCEPCQGGIAALTVEKRAQLISELNPQWSFSHEKTHIRREFKFKNFKEAMLLADEIGEIAEQENHHPELSFGWGHLEVEIWTHKIDSLVESDFILAARIDSIKTLI